MKAIKRPLIYFLIWLIWTCISIGLSRNMSEIGAFLLQAIISVVIYIIAYYHIIFSIDKIVKEREPELYDELEKELSFRFHPELNAVSQLIFTGRAKKYPSIRPQIREFIAFLIFALITFIIFAVRAVFITFK